MPMSHTINVSDLTDADNFDELSDARFASQYGGDDFDIDVSGFVCADTAIALGNPTFGQVGDLFAG